MSNVMTWRMAGLLNRIAYPRRGTSDEHATAEDFANEIHEMFSMDALQEIIDNEEPRLDEEITALLREGRRIAAIKLCQVRLMYDLRGARAYVDTVESNR